MSLRQRTGGTPDPTPVYPADLLIDDDLPALDRVCKYTSAAVALMRLVHVSMLSDVAQDVGYGVMVDRLLPLLPKLCDDDEWVVRTAVAPEIATMCQLCVALGFGKGYDLVVSQLLPLLAKLAGDSHDDVRASGAKGLAVVSIMLKPEDLAVHLFTIVIELANAEGQDEAVDLRMAAAKLMELLAPHLGEELCEHFLVPTIQNLAEDDNFRVRKAVALHLADIIRTCIPEVNEERLLPMFLTLAYDEIWGVRKACAESIMEMSRALDEDGRLSLVRTMCSLLEDDTRWVSDSAYENLGQFITTLPAECWGVGGGAGSSSGGSSSSSSSSEFSSKDNQRLLTLYKECSEWDDSTTESGAGAEEEDGSGGSTTPNHYGTTDDNDDSSEMLAEGREYWCAFSLPGVLQTLGKGRWASDLREVHAKLACSASTHVRRSLAFSLHQIANIVGADVAENDLCSIFDSFITDEEEVRVGAITHLASFLQQLHLPARESYLPVMAEVIETADATNWRVRESIARQLPEFSVMFTPPATFSVVVSVLFRLLHDEISIVRRNASRCCGLLINRLAEEEDVDWSEQLAMRLVGFSAAASYPKRLTFLHVCEYLIRQVSVVSKIIFEFILFYFLFSHPATLSFPYITTQTQIPKERFMTTFYPPLLVMAP